MSKITNILLVSAIVFGLSACATAPVAEKKQVLDERCMFPGSDKLAPGWVCHEAVEGLPISAMGSAPKSGAGVQFMTTQATAAGRVALASQAKVYVAAMVKNYVGTTGVGTSETVDAASESVTKQITDATLIGSRLVKSATGPDGTMYVLVGLDPAPVEKMAEKALKTSMNNDKALWQKFQAGKSQDELAADIAKQKVDAEKLKQ